MAKVKAFYFNCLKTRVKGSSLIEVTAALVIISMIFGFAITIYLNVQRTAFTTNKISYYLMLDEAYSSIKKPSDLVSKEFQIEELTISQHIEKHGSSEGLMLIKLELRTAGGKMLAEKKYLKYVATQP